MSIIKNMIETFCYALCILKVHYKVTTMNLKFHQQCFLLLISEWIHVGGIINRISLVAFKC